MRPSRGLSAAGLGSFWGPMQQNFVARHCAPTPVESSSEMLGSETPTPTANCLVPARADLRIKPNDGWESDHDATGNRPWNLGGHPRERMPHVRLAFRLLRPDGPRGGGERAQPFSEPGGLGFRPAGYEHGRAHATRRGSGRGCRLGGCPARARPRTGTGRCAQHGTASHRLRRSSGTHYFRYRSTRRRFWCKPGEVFAFAGRCGRRFAAGYRDGRFVGGGWLVGSTGLAPQRRLTTLSRHRRMAAGDSRCARVSAADFPQRLRAQETPPLTRAARVSFGLCRAVCLGCSLDFLPRRSVSRTMRLARSGSLRGFARRDVRLCAGTVKFSPPAMWVDCTGS